MLRARESYPGHLETGPAMPSVQSREIGVEIERLCSHTPVRLLVVDGKPAPTHARELHLAAPCVVMVCRVFRHVTAK